MFHYSLYIFVCIDSFSVPSCIFVFLCTKVNRVSLKNHSDTFARFNKCSLMRKELVKLRFR